MGNAIIDATTLTISQCHSTGNFTDTGTASSVNGNWNGLASGGLIGSLGATNSATVSVSRCYYNGAIDYSGNAKTPSNVGGLFGLLKSTSSSVTVANSYALTSIKLNNLAMNSIGGLIGLGNHPSGSAPTISNAYASTSFSQITNALKVGGFIGNNNVVSLSGSYWNQDLYATGVGNGSSVGVTGETDAALKTETTFSGWDFTSIWLMPVGGMPILQ